MEPTPLESMKAGKQRVVYLRAALAHLRIPGTMDELKKAAMALEWLSAMDALYDAEIKKAEDDKVQN